MGSIPWRDGQSGGATVAGGATRVLPQGGGLVLLLVACLLLSGCQLPVMLAGRAMEADLRRHKREQAELSEYRKKLVSFGAVAPTEVAGRRFDAGELKLLTHSDWRGEVTTTWIIVNFNKVWKEASYKALVRAECAKKELWIESWQTFASADALGGVVDSGNPPSPHRLPDHDPFAKVAQRICDGPAMEAPATEAELRRRGGQLLSFGAVASNEVAGRRFGRGELKLWTTRYLRSEDTAWIVVNFDQSMEREASYKAFVRADCATNELWIERWETFASADGSGVVVNKGNPPSPQRLPGHDPFAKVAQRICEERSAHAAVMAFRQGFQPLGDLPTAQFVDRFFPPGRLSVWRDRGPAPHGERAWIVVDFYQTPKGGEASYGALVRVDCQKHELWVEHWTTFGGNYGLERVIDQRILPAPRKLEPAGHETLQAAARWMCGSSAS